MTTAATSDDSGHASPSIDGVVKSFTILKIGTSVTSSSSAAAFNLHDDPTLHDAYPIASGSSSSMTAAGGGFGAESELSTDSSLGPDPAVRDALKSTKERLFVLKLGEEMEVLIQDQRCVGDHL